MKIEYDVEINTEGRGEWALLVTDFLSSGKKNMCIECETRRERNTAYNSIYITFIKRKGASNLILKMRDLKLYVINSDIK